MPESSLPTERLVELIETCCPTEQWQEQAKQLNPEEVQWIANTCNLDLEKMKMTDVLELREGDNWELFIDYISTNNFYLLEEATESYLSKYSREVKHIREAARDIIEHPDEDMKMDKEFMKGLKKNQDALIFSLKQVVGEDAKEVYDNICDKVLKIESQSQKQLPTSSEKPAQREGWEKNMISRAFANLKDIAPADAEGGKTTQVGKYTISFQESSQTLQISDKERGILYKSLKGQPSTVCKFSEDEKNRFLQIKSQPQKLNISKGREHE